MFYEVSKEEDTTFSGVISKKISKRRCYVKEGIKGMLFLTKTQTSQEKYGLCGE